jgi:Tfp pilus assembly protein PilO
MAAKKGTWIGGTAFVACALAAGTWFLAVHPTLSDAAGLRAQTEQVNQSNDLLQKKITKLAADFQKLPQYQQQLDQLRTQVPTTGQLTDYVRQVDQIAAAHTVVVTNMGPGSAKLFVLAQGAAPVAPAPAASPSATPSATPTTDGTGATATTSGAASGVPAGMVAIPMSITVVGTYDNTLAFLSDLQTATPRLFLVSSVNATAQKEQPAGGGRPATHKGDQELIITGSLYVLPDPTAGSAPAPSQTPTPLPAPIPGKNPLVPVAGQ